MDSALNSYRYRMPVSLRWSDMDEMRHVNNAVYATYFEDARGRFLKQTCDWDWSVDGIILAKICIEFKQAIRVEDECYLYVKISRIGTKSFNLQYAMSKIKNGQEEIVALCESVQVMYDYKLQASIPIPQRLIDRLTAA